MIFASPRPPRAPARAPALRCVRARAAWSLAAWLSLALLGGALAPAATSAQSTENAEARAFFDQGNRAFERSQRASGVRRAGLLEEALAAYVASLSIVRSKNALFNAGVTLAALGRSAEAYGYFGEYLALGGLSEGERAAADEQQRALEARVMMVHVDSRPGGGEVRVDRPDLQALGRTPLTLPLEPGLRVLLVRGPDGRDVAAQVLASAGGEERVVVDLGPEPGAEAGAEPGAETATPTDADPDTDSDADTTPDADAQLRAGTELSPDARADSASSAHAETPPALHPQAPQRSGPGAPSDPSRASPTRARNGALFTGGLGLGLAAGALGLWARGRELSSQHRALEADPRPWDERVRLGEALYDQIERSNRASQSLTVLSVVTLGVSLGLTLRAARAGRRGARVSVSTDLAGLRVGVTGALR